MKRGTIYSMLFFAAILTGCGGKNEQKNAIVTTNAVNVKVVEVKASNTGSTFRYSGTVEASRTIPLTFQSTGTVEKVFVDAGDVVKKGQLLATTDKSNSQSMYDMAMAKFKQAQDAYNRLKTVHDQGSLPDIKWVEMESNLEQAKSSLAMSKDNLEKCSLYAPSNGVVGKRNIEPGMSALSISGAPLELVEINDVYIKITVPENEISKLHKGQTASITVSALENKSFSGQILKLSPVADAIARTYEVNILVKNQSFELKPGMVCDVSISPAGQNVCMLIPYQAATKDDDDRTFVYVVDKTTRHVKKQIIETGNYCGSNIEVISGLSTGQTIVSEGKEKISDNTEISF